MKNSWRGLIHSMVLLSGISLLVLSCDENEGSVLSPAELQAISRAAAENNHQIIVATQEVLDITSAVLSEEGISVQESNAKPENCAPSLLREYVMDRTHRDTIIYAGTITIDYGNGSSCGSQGPVRAGKIKDTFTYIISTLNDGTYRVYQTIDFENYQRDTISLTGKFRTDAATGEPDSLETFGAKINFKSGTSIHWNGTLANTRVNSGSLTDDLKTITGKVNGTTPDGNLFVANITKGILYNYDCLGSDSLIPVQGTLTMEVKANKVKIDYGNGECDREYSVSINGVTTIYSF
jgi:hypothetical protein